MDPSERGSTSRSGEVPDAPADGPEADADLGLPISAATALLLDAGSISILAPERDGNSVLLWNRRVPPRPVLVADMAIRVPHVRS